jgi:hypothetical protein
MANSDFRVLSTLDSILSGHLNAIAKGVMRLEDLLGLSSDSVSDHELTPVIDQSVIALRYRIYEATGGYRNWLDSPTPVIYRNAVEVDSGEYVLHKGFGLIIFNSQQLPGDTITADFDYIKDSQSTVVSEVNRKVGPVYVPNQYKSVAPAYRSVTVSADTYYILPLEIPETLTFDRIGTDIVAALAGNMCVSIWANDNGYPGELIYDGELDVSSTGVTVLSEDIILNKGLYWIGFITDVAVDIQGVVTSYINPIASDWNPVKNYVGYTLGATYTNEPPNPFSGGASLVAMEDAAQLGAVFLRRKSS